MYTLSQSKLSKIYFFNVNIRVLVPCDIIANLQSTAIPSIDECGILPHDKGQPLAIYDSQEGAKEEDKNSRYLIIQILAIKKKNSNSNYHFYSPCNVTQ